MCPTALTEKQKQIDADALPLTHPYPRYGLAVALVENRLQLNELTEHDLREALVYCIEVGLGNFRMRTADSPELTRLLTFTEIKMEELEADKRLVQSSGLAAKGIYIFPTILTTDGNAKDTWKNAIETVKQLRGGTSLESREKFSRSFAPTTAKINNGTASQTEPKGSLLEVACSLVTTLTPIKPAAWPGQNTIIIPDLSIEKMCNFVALFKHMTDTKLDGNLMEAKLKEIKPADANKTKRATKKTTKAGIPKSEFRRPRLHSGNYPYAPYDAGTFGAVGLLGAIGRWAMEYSESNWPEKAIHSLADLENCPLYIISYDKISQACFSHHVVRLAMNGELSKLVDALWRATKLYADLDSPFTHHESPAYQLFYLHASRFLQSFTPVAYANFLASRAEYPPELQSLFEEYFMKKIEINADIVSSAQAYGQWINSIAYIVAQKEVDEWAKDRKPKPSETDIKSRTRKIKANILVGLESVAMSSQTPQEMLSRIQSQVGRLLQNEAPYEAARFLEAVNTGDLEPPLPQQLFMTYLRLRSERPKHPSTVSENQSEAADKAGIAAGESVKGL